MPMGRLPCDWSPPLGALATLVCECMGVCRLSVMTSVPPSKTLPRQGFHSSWEGGLSSGILKAGSIWVS